jgi:uncharacterized protein (TIGR03437 family)
MLTRFSRDLEAGAPMPLQGVTDAKLAFDQAGNLLLSGSATPALPTVAPLQGPFSPMTGFVSAMAPDFSGILFSTFAGDRHIFSVANAASAPDGSITFAGSTQPSSLLQGDYYPFPPGSDDSGSGDVYVARLAPRVPALRLDSITNAASFAANPLAANETVVIRGQGFGEDAAAIVDGQELPILSRAPDRMVAVIPAGFRSDGSARVEVESGSARSNSVLMPASAASPGVFSVDGSGAGQGYILGSNGTLNSTSNPAAEGESITIYLTGGSPGVAAAVFVNGFPANVLGAVLETTEEFPGPVLKLRAVVPQLPFKPPAVSVQVVSGEVKSQIGITMSVK